MTRYRHALPQLAGRLFLTDGGMETTFIFDNGLDLPCFAAFDLLRRPGGAETIRAYYRRHAAIARAAGLGFILEGATWRASADWGRELGYSAAALAAANRAAIGLIGDLRAELDSPAMPVVVSACIGPRGDGYDPGRIMSADEAQEFHSVQVAGFADTEADMVTAMTMTNIPEAVGVARAAHAAGLPCAISFTVETDGRLPTGEALGDAIAAVDAATGSAPAYYMLNCAHPDHFADMLAAGGDWLGRLRGVRANAS
ncbi:MAG: homocysteine S-methyltransferase family protein, partial [Alphaproteobacteria bacterium]